MRRKINILWKSIVSTFIYIFIILYFLFIITLYIIPSNFKIPIIQLFGFAIIIIIIFYFFINLNQDDVSNKIIFNFKALNENSIKIILMLLMSITIFIPPISFTESIIDWNQIGFFNYFRSIVLLIGCAFLPGANIFKIIFPKDTLKERFDVEHFLIKITIYPILSFTFLGLSTFILEKIGLIREYFTLVLFLIIIILFFFDLLIQRLCDCNNLKFNRPEIKISKYTLLILLIALGIIIISLSVNLNAKYLIPGDRWRGINSAYLIGWPTTSPTDSTANYAIYWGYISFGLSTLSGIPYININVLLFPFVYLFITSIYLFMKALLHELKDIYALLSTILVIIFSGLFYIFNSNLEWNATPFTRLAILSFSYHSFAFISLFLSMALFIIITKTSRGLETKSFFKTEEFKLIILVALFLLQSYMTYFLTVIPGISLIFIYCLFSKKKKKNFKIFLIFWSFLLMFFILIDIISAFFFSWIPSTLLSNFLGTPVYIQAELYTTRRFLTALFNYSILIGSLILFISIYIIYNKFFSGDKKWHLKFKIIPKKIILKFLFIFSLIIFSVFLVIEIYYIFLRDILPRFFPNNSFPVSIEENFFTYYIDLIFLNIGFIGILGIYLSYFCFKKKRRLFYILLSWGLFIFVLSSILIFRRWLQHPFTPPLEIPKEEYYYIIYWFDRIWFYSIIPLSIFSAIGIIRLRKYFKSQGIKKSRVIYNLTLASFIIFLSFSHVIIDGMYWVNRDNIYTYYIKDEEAQMIGWVSENIPSNSNILIDRTNIKPELDDITYCTTYYIWEEKHKALENYTGFTTNYRYDSNCVIEFVEELDRYENVLKFSDYNDTGHVYLEIKFDSAQENGSIEFLLKTTNATNIFRIYFYSYYERIKGISLAIEHDGFFYRDGENVIKIMDIENDVWYHYKIDFECTNGSYNGLKKFNWKAMINGIEYGDNSFWENVSQIGYMEFFSDNLNSGWNIYFDSFNFSWAQNFNIEKYILNWETQVIIDNLKSKNIEYFILSKHNKDNYKELISNFYKKKLYEYGNLSIYYSNNI